MTLTAPQRLDEFSNGNPKPDQKAAVLAAHDRLKERDPRELSAAEFAAIGHDKRPLLAVIRQNCIACQGGYTPDNHPETEVRNCRATGCCFWPYRMGTDPFRAPASEAKREAARRMARNRLASQTSNDGIDVGVDDPA